MPKAVYRKGCRNKHNRPRRDSNLSRLTPQADALTTRLLRRFDVNVKANAHLAPTMDYITDGINN